MRALLPLIVLLSASCAPAPEPAPVWNPAAPGAWPFAPAALRLHPLTHVERTQAGEAVIMCHIELLDFWGDTTKGVGELHIELLRPVPGGNPVVELTWDIDLRDPNDNVTLYDQSTRTYRIQLADLPEWSRQAADAASTRFILRATLTGPNPEGLIEELSDELAVRG